MVMFSLYCISCQKTRKLFDITKLVKGWYEGTYENNGIMLKKAVETGSDEDVAANCTFWSDKYNNIIKTSF